MRRAGLTGTGEQLSVYDLQHGRRIGGATYDGSRSDRGVGRFTRIRLARTGAAVYIVELADGGGRLVGDTAGEVYADDTLEFNPDPGRIDPETLGFAGSTVAWRTGDTFGLSQLAELDELSSPSGTLLRLGRVRVVANSSRYQDELRARIGGRPFVRLGEPMFVCLGSSGCGGVEALQRAGRYLATRYFSYSAGDVYGWLTIHDLRSGRSRTLCRASSMSPSGRGSVAAFVLTRRGTAACAVSFEVPGALREHQIRAEGAILDQGSAIELDSLRRRDDRLVWVHGGVEHTAPLP